MHPLNRSAVKLASKHPIKVIQFGTGNFLRAFADYAFGVLNASCGTEIGVAVIQSTSTGNAELLNEQEGLFTLLTRGISNNQEIKTEILIDVITTCVNAQNDFSAFLELAREPDLLFMVSNTTEAGIRFNPEDRPNMKPPESFPAKLTLFLYARFSHFNGAMDKGLMHLPCELIENNADTLKEILIRYAEMWNLGDAFITWILQANSFHNTLVDRIVTGFPTAEAYKLSAKLGYTDSLMVASEPYFLWLIEGDERLKNKLPFHKTSLKVKIVSDIGPYRNRKVKILNGAHLALVPLGLMQGFDSVGEAIHDSFTFVFISEMLFEEVIPVIPMDKTDLETYTQEVFERFRNPFVEHKLENIALNAISKFKVRLLPSIIAYVEIKKSIPLHITFVFAMLLIFYKRNWNGVKLPVQDNAKITSFFDDIWNKHTLSEAVPKILDANGLWNHNMQNLQDLEANLVRAITCIETQGITRGWHSFNTESTQL